MAISISEFVRAITRLRRVPVVPANLTPPTEPEAQPVGAETARKRTRKRQRKSAPMPRYTLAEMISTLNATAEMQRGSAAAATAVMAESGFAAAPVVVTGVNGMARDGDVLASVAGLLCTLRREALKGGDVREFIRRMP